jgi:hypothetical protein
MVEYRVECRIQTGDFWITPPGGIELPETSANQGIFLQVKKGKRKVGELHIGNDLIGRKPSGSDWSYITWDELSEIFKERGKPH